MTDSKNQEVVMYMPTKLKLLEYAQRIKQDLPFDVDVVKFEKVKADLDDESVKGDEISVTFEKTRNLSPKIDIKLGGFEDIVTSEVFYQVNEIADKHYLTVFYRRVVNTFGQFQQEAIVFELSIIGTEVGD